MTITMGITTRMIMSLTPLPLHQFVFLTYILGLAFLGIFGFSAIPVFLFYNMWTTCAAMKSPMANITDPDTICVDVRQYGECHSVTHTHWSV